MSHPTATGYAPVNGVGLYWESYGQGGTPLVVVHGGFGLITMPAELIEELSARRRVVPSSCRDMVTPGTSTGRSAMRPSGMTSPG